MENVKIEEFGVLSTDIIGGDEKKFTVWADVHCRTDIKPQYRVILCPGYLDSRGYPHLETVANELALAGAQVIRFDAPGTWDSGPNIEDYTMTNYLAAIDFFVNHTKKKVILIGHSRGGKMALLYAGQNPEKIAGVGILMSSHNLTLVDDNTKDLAQQGKTRNSARSNPNGEGIREYKVPYANLLKDQEIGNPADYLQHIKMPSLCLWGEFDEIVPKDVAFSTHYKLHSISGKCSFAELPTKHNYWENPVDLAEVNEVIVGWFERTFK